MANVRLSTVLIQIIYLNNFQKGRIYAHFRTFKRQNRDLLYMELPNYIKFSKYDPKIPFFLAGLDPTLNPCDWLEIPPQPESF